MNINKLSTQNFIPDRKAALVSILLFLFFVVIGIFTNIKPLPIDIKINSILQSFRTPGLNQFFFLFTSFGEVLVVLNMVLAVSLVLFIYNKKSFIVEFLIIFLLTTVSIYITKSLFHRSRPEAGIYIVDSFSFPSGHATIAMSLYGYLIYVFEHHFLDKKIKYIILFLGILLIILIGLSRLYLGVHFLTDIIGGYLLGAAWLIYAINITKKDNRLRDTVVKETRIDLSK